MTHYVLLVSSDSELNDELLSLSTTHANKSTSMLNDDVQWVLPNDPNAHKAIMAACWYPDSTILSEFPALECLHSLAAGADHLGDALLNAALPVCRIVDNEQKKGMLEYVLWAVLYFQRDFDRAIQGQTQRHWQRYPQQKAQDIQIGVMGLGEIGLYVAQGLEKQGYTVAGWSNSKKDIPNVQCFAGKDELHSFLKNTDILVNLLPLNHATNRIIDSNFIKQLKSSASLINCGRGGHVDYNALQTALESETLRGAILDVFDEEPLAQDSPLWEVQNLLITPHMASASSSEVLIEQVSENTRRLATGSPLNNRIN
ncbi:2-hydroxyacid dehydrogenase [Marinomonas balearica]|uniref:Glyoxylate/hydroxypyruvate reductase A n=1 Tax=Marinomonas balearica TaxID=491947 RepID=A0A4R6M272_9GAMM|nr:glyoxylate/hydroxypyruvate reductase A [Marinomonas balearica]TDO95348.1 glyoxylate/hydroxypyruvate reductase A [Marinomonas balearica]